MIECKYLSRLAFLSLLLFYTNVTAAIQMMVCRKMLGRYSRLAPVIQVYDSRMPSTRLQHSIPPRHWPCRPLRCRQQRFYPPLPQVQPTPPRMVRFPRPLSLVSDPILSTAPDPPAHLKTAMNPLRAIQCCPGGPPKRLAMEKKTTGPRRRKQRRKSRTGENERRRG